VPNVSHPPRTQKDAEAILKRAHFVVSVETLALSNVPPGYVISQNPLPAAKAAAGTTVNLVVSAAA
jgi:beta-lactam-binding protein with PASTA domain